MATVTRKVAALHADHPHSFLVSLDFWSKLVTKLEPQDEGILAQFVPKGMRHVVEEA